MSWYEKAKALDDTLVVEKRENEATEEDAYYLAIGSLIHDIRIYLHPTNQAAKVLHLVRLSTSLVVIVALIFLQVTVMYQIQLLVTSISVHDIREDYDQYEFVMYGSNESHTYLNVNGKHRGYPKYFQPELFRTLSPEIRKGACNIPFSQLTFFTIVVIIWALTCMVQFRRCLELCGYVLVINTVESMKEAVVDEESTEGVDYLVVGMPMFMKVFLFPLLFLPWFTMTAYLLWLGTRWLASTNDFGATVGNAVALEFILNLKDLLYLVLVPEKSKRELKRIQFAPLVREEVSHVSAYIGNFGWGLLAFLWAYLYINQLQTVLPEYKWDVHDVCTGYYSQLLVYPDAPG